MRPVIVLFTDAAEIAPETLTAMREAGYLPVKVNDANAIRILEIPAGMPDGDLSVIQTAALRALVKSAEVTVNHTAKFGLEMATLLLGKRP